MSVNSPSDDVAAMKAALAALPVDWEGKASVLELKEADYNWRQMEWWGFYFEYISRRVLAGVCAIPGERFGTVTFDLKRTANWNLKASAIKSDNHRAILNDRAATDASIERHGWHGVVVALCDVEYNDSDRSFQRWHTELKGGQSAYEKKRIERTSVSRYRKTHATLTEILFLSITAANVGGLSIMRQGQNSNGKPRPEKYMVNLERIEPFYVDRMTFP